MTPNSMNDYFWKKPVRIRAWQFAPGEGVPDWLVIPCKEGKIRFDNDVDCAPTVTVFTLEGSMTGKAGDWIIEGVKGELYPCRDDIFQATYTNIAPNKK